MFIETRASKLSLAMRKSLFGIGINDSDYKIHYVVGSKRYDCPFYRVWAKMLERCYSIEFQRRNPTYRTASVTKEWLTFSSFKAKEIKRVADLQANKKVRDGLYTHSELIMK